MEEEEEKEGIAEIACHRVIGKSGNREIGK
jgi:hypothetical protein